MLVSKNARTRYKFDLNFFREDGHVVFVELSTARAFAMQISALRSRPAPASDLYAASLLDEALHLLLNHYFDSRPGLLPQLLGQLQASFEAGYEVTLIHFVEEYPPQSVFVGEQTGLAYLNTRAVQDGDQGAVVRSRLLKDMLVVKTANSNPALSDYQDLFDDSPLKNSAYQQIVRHLMNSAGLDASTGSVNPLDEILNGPIRAYPNSLDGQLRFILEKWAHILGEDFSARILRGLDFIKEEEMHHSAPPGDHPQAHVPHFDSSEYAEYERFSMDREWMPSLVLIAKNTYVWLHQLSRKYQRDISRLDQIPDEELNLLAQRGFTGLWLIGLWERSKASKHIKQRMGQQDAVASAYSLYAYDIAGDLGGWDSLGSLRQRAWKYGIRLAADMVPNHMGIDSKWVVEHPDWFLSISYPPFPSYSFRSENLSEDLRVGIYLEDHYYDKTDAAVVFQRRDLQTGDLRYIYHGNDGTSFPWNDTAQLDYTKAHVREAVIQTILHVARNFPVIRFDAAMTLAKKHIQRLWFPEPGSGGAIPSRAQFGLTKTEFDALIPEEFWREVVDRVAAEAPDTLLLAEAFWLMEGYFVRTLGMHRVYNSAFMHMLRDEDNDKYRMTIKNTLAFDPQILKRYVNFMNNPDEKTASEQFGTGEKYFGVAILLSTLPGLPMFGHGQIEGYAEKYGMEFRRPKMDEQVNDGLVGGHEWMIFPLLHRRRLFADVDHFLLFDFYTPSGGVDENVFAYSNRLVDERALVIYHNRYAETKGWIKTSAAYLHKESGDLRQRSLAEGLDLPFDGYVIFRDQVTHLQYIRSCAEIWEKGMYFELHAYQAHVFVDWEIVLDERWAEICAALNGLGVDSVHAKWAESFTEPPLDEEVKKKPARRKPAAKKPTAKKPATAKKSAAKKTALKKPAVKKPAAKSTPPAKAKSKPATSKAKTKPALKKTTPKKTASAKKAPRKK